MTHSLFAWVVSFLAFFAALGVGAIVWINYVLYRIGRIEKSTANIREDLEYPSGDPKIKVRPSDRNTL
jgi:hypothetical protein